MATQNNKPVISLWLCLLLLAIGSGLMLFIDSHLDPAERAFGICHGSTLETQHARIYKFDNIDSPSTDKLRAAFPGNNLLVDNRSEIGVIRLIFLGFLAFTVCLNLRFFWLHVRDEIARLYRAGPGKNAMFLLPLAISGLLYHYQIATIWTACLYCFLVFRLSTKSARGKVKIKGFSCTLKWLRVVGLTWFSQVALTTLATNPSEELGSRFAFFAMIFLAAFIPTLKFRSERVKGDEGSLEAELAAWSASRYWMLTIGIVTAIVQQSQGFEKFLGGWTSFLWPTLALVATKTAVSGLGQDENPGRRQFSSLSRVVACSWLILGLPAAVSLDSWQFGERPLAVWVFGLAFLFQYGRPWGSTAKNSKRSLAEPESRIPVAGVETSDQNVPASCAITVGVVSILTFLSFIISPIQLPSDWNTEKVDQIISESLDNQRRVLNVGEHGFQVIKVGEAAHFEHQTLFVQDTWPELVGLALQGLAGFLALGLIVLWTNHQWDQGLREELRGEALPIVGATFGAYALGGIMDWHWASPTPYVVLYLIFTTAPRWLTWIPLRSRLPVQLSAEPLGQDSLVTEREDHFREALDIQIVAGADAARLFGGSSREMVHRLTGQFQPDLDKTLEPNLVCIVCSGKAIHTQTVREPGEFEKVTQQLQAVLRKRSKRVLTFDRVQSWLDFQSESFPGAAQQVKSKCSIGTLQFVLRKLVERGSMLEEPEVILDVLATAVGDEYELVEQCVESLGLSESD